MKTIVNPLLLVGFLGTMVFGSHFAANAARAFWGDRDIWWTPRSLRLPLDRTENEFALYVGEKPFAELLAGGLLRVVDENDEIRVLHPDNVRVGINNWHKTRASFLAHSTISGVAFGAFLALLGVGLAGLRTQRKNAKTGQGSA